METGIMTSRQQRKRYAKRGNRAQKQMTFRLDIDNAQWLETKQNKGRYINNLIAADRQQERN